MRPTVALLLLVASSAAAQEERIAADRPGFADGASTVGAAVIQLETSVDAQQSDELQISLPTLIRVGITDRLEFRLESDVAELSESTKTLAPLAAGLKLRMRDGAVPLALVASVQASEPEAEARLVSDLDLGGGLSLTPNAGISLVEGEGATSVFAATLEKELHRVTPFVDFETTVGRRDAMVIDTGLVWFSGTNTQLDVSVGFAVTGDEYPDWFVAAGFSRRRR